jgi:ring-1,2-phenylacetyl-CoA epoxidase subunit PaaC
MSAGNPLFEYLLRLGDNGVILGHRLSEWCGHGPVLEEDLALTNVALDLIGQARLWLTLAGEVEGGGRDEDQLAYLRDTREYRNLLLVEQPNGDYAHTLARQFYFDSWHHFLLRGLTESTDRRVAEIAGKSLKEVAYHLRRSGDWVVTLGDGTEESRHRMQTAVDELWPFCDEMFTMDAVDTAMAERGIGVDLERLREPWTDHVRTVMEEATLRIPNEDGWQRGGKNGVHSEHLGYILADMQFLQRAYPAARW